MTNEDDRGGLGRVLAASVVAVLCGLVVGYLALNPGSGDDNDTALELSRTSNTDAGSTVPSESAPVTEVDVDPVDAQIADDAADPDLDDELASTTIEPEPEPDPDPPPTSEAVEVVPETSTTMIPEATTGGASYPTLDDGTPVPIVGIYDGDTIVLSGMIPSQESSDYLETLAIANSTSPNASVANFMTINPDVPLGVGVRVIEMEAARFGESSSSILPENAEQFDRVVSIMNALPNISVVVIGHADQRGDPDRNFEISAARAQSVVEYMAARGIDPARMASRAVGEADLLSLNSDDMAFELNRRTEFIFYGLLVK